MPAILDYCCVLALRQERNFARAAVALGISQPALTARIRRLEQDLDVKLFDRGRHGARVTAAGSAFAEAAERIVALAEEAATAAQGAEHGTGQSLRIGYTQISARVTLLPILKRFGETYPMMRVRLREATTVQLEALVAQDRLDAALLHPPIHSDGLSELHLHSCKILRIDHGSPSGVDRPPIEYPRGDAPVLLSEYHRRYPTAHLAPPAAEADTALGALLLSEAGYGPCVVAEDTWSVAEQRADSVATPLDMRLHTSLVWRSTDRRSTVRKLIETCRQQSAFS